MKILLFEYISGGGLHREALPEGLAREGGLMLQALLNGFADLPHELVVMLDSRLHEQIELRGAQCVLINFRDDCLKNFLNLLFDCDAVWLVAPEFDGILQNYCALVESSGKTLLTSPSSAVALTANKFTTYQRLCQFGIATVPTRRLSEFNSDAAGEWLIKPVDGVGCLNSGLLSVLGMPKNREQFIVQPHLQGDKTSLSCLFKGGAAWLLCVNRQQFAFAAGRYQLTGIEVNIAVPVERYLPLLDALARAFSELWGYVGIDLIETPDALLVLEINPRLTSSFVGIQAATGVNVCACVMQLLNAAPVIMPTHSQTIQLRL